eukprot:TRINITY_DN257_c0_g1_i18.p1 TRINITY_DN257_c0_g1~~TRINITY_DN257_c0_g1_i18.p1  ORF type:complete len:756 (+),score=243.39 TRINITY_DN257_c0_g1_i18:132-2270(+)
MMKIPALPRARGGSVWGRQESVMALLVVLMVVGLGQAGLPCSSDGQCRRSVCIFDFCKPRSVTGGPCETNSHCVKTTDTCVNNVCGVKSPPGGTCDLNDSGDCVINSKCDGTLCNFESNKAMSLQRANSASVAVNGFYFVFGGFASSSTNTFTRSVEMYSPANNSWVTKADIPVVVWKHSVVAIGDFVFLIGGADPSNVAQTHFYRYDTVNNVWSTASDYTQLPSPGILFTTATAVGNTIYWFGGFASGSAKNTIASFDTSNPSGQWTFPTTLTAADRQMSAVTVGKLIYITGGLNGGTLTRVYDTDKPNVPPITLSGALTISRASHASFFNPNDNKIYLVGGVPDIPNRDKTVETFDLGSSSPAWTGVPSAALNLLYTLNSGGLIGSRFYTAGSISTASSVLSVLELSGSPHWIPFAPSLLPVYYMVVGKIGSSIITAGGVSQSDTTTDTNKYDIPSDSWSTSSATLSPATTQAASAVAGSEMFAFGGAISGAAVKNTKVLNAGQTSWDARADMTYARSGACAAFEGTKVYVYGGRDGSTVLDAMEIYETDPAQVSTFDKWEDVTTSSKEFNNPAPVHNCAAISTGSKILIFGGKMNESPVSRVGMIQSFDIASKKWDEPLPASITPRYFHSATVLNGFVIVSGGTINNSNPVGTVEAFRISTGEVIALPDMPTPRFGHGSVTDGNAVIFVGGLNGEFIASIEKIRPSLPA